MDTVQVAKALYQLQAGYNDGRGVSCVRTICLYLERNDIDSAKAVCLNEGDKIRNYPAIVNFLKKKGLLRRDFR